MNKNDRISRKALIKATGNDPATYSPPQDPEPEDYIAEPVVTVFYGGSRPHLLAYSPIHPWFNGWGANHLRAWRKRYGANRDRKAFESWYQLSVWGHDLGMGCDVLDLRQPTDRIRFAEALASVDPAHVPLAAEYMRAHCSEGSLGWTPPVGEERLGEYRSEVERTRAKGNPSGPCLVTRGLPASYAAPAIERATRQATQAAQASGLVFDLLVFEPILGPIDPFHVSHLYVAGTRESVDLAAAADCVDEARRRVLAEGGYTVRLYGEAGAETSMASQIVQALGWLRDQAAAHHTPIIGTIAMR